MLIVGLFPETVKPSLDTGTAKMIEFSFNVKVSDSNLFEIFIDESMKYVTYDEFLQHVDDRDKHITREEIKRMIENFGFSEEDIQKIIDEINENTNLSAEKIIEIIEDTHNLTSEQLKGLQELLTRQSDDLNENTKLLLRSLYIKIILQRNDNSKIESLEWALKELSKTNMFGVALREIYDFPEAIFDDLKTMEDVCLDSEAVTIINRNEEASQLVSDSPSFTEAMENSITYLENMTGTEEGVTFLLNNFQSMRYILKSKKWTEYITKNSEFSYRLFLDSQWAPAIAKDTNADTFEVYMSDDKLLNEVISDGKLIKLILNKDIDTLLYLENLSTKENSTKILKQPYARKLGDISNLGRVGLLFKNLTYDDKITYVDNVHSYYGTSKFAKTNHKFIKSMVQSTEEQDNIYSYITLSNLYNFASLDTSHNLSLFMNKITKEGIVTDLQKIGMVVSASDFEKRNRHNRMSTSLVRYFNTEDIERIIKMIDENATPSYTQVFEGTNLSSPNLDLREVSNSRGILIIKLDYYIENGNHTVGGIDFELNGYDNRWGQHPYRGTLHVPTGKDTTQPIIMNTLNFYSYPNDCTFYGEINYSYQRINAKFTFNYYNSNSF